MRYVVIPAQADVVIPAQAGIQFPGAILDARLRGHDDRP
jgi:hypothetical protein